MRDHRIGFKRVGWTLMVRLLIALLMVTACTPSNNPDRHGMTGAEYREVKAFFASGKMIIVTEEPFTTWTPAQQEAIKRMAAEAHRPLVGNEERY